MTPTSLVMTMATKGKGLSSAVQGTLLAARSRPCAICASQFRGSAHHQQNRPVHHSSRRRHASTVNADEISHFSSLSHQWWDEGGSFNVLQRMNKVRVQFLRERLLEAALYESSSPEIEREKLLGPQALAGLKVLDIGCGGGLFAERLARLGANTLAIDASSENVKSAALHAEQDPHLQGLMFMGSLEYRGCAAEELLQESPDSMREQFDIVFAMEVLEHVDDPRAFLQCVADLTKPGGHFIASTISRTPLARLLAIDVAESALVGYAPAGSHTYSKFVKPDELTSFFRDQLRWGTPLGCATDTQNLLGNDLSSSHRSHRSLLETRGTTYLPWKGEWQLFDKDEYGGLKSTLAKSCNYFFGARKPLT